MNIINDMFNELVKMFVFYFILHQQFYLIKIKIKQYLKIN